MSLFQLPPPTRYDLRFTIAGIPVRVHPLFWLVAPAALITPLLAALIALGAHKGFDFFLQDRGQNQVDRVPEFGL